MQLIRTLGNRIFVLDNQFNTNGNGVVFVFRISDAGDIIITEESRIDYSTFGIAEDRINDFELVKLSDLDSAFFLSTMSKTGLVFGTFFTNSTPFVLNYPGVKSLGDDPAIFSYQLKGSEFLQI